MPSIPSITGGSISIAMADVASVIAFPNLTSISGIVDIESCPLLTSITFPLSPVFTAKNLTFKNNALTVVCVNDLMAKVNSNGTSNGTLDLSGINNADPTGQGLIDMEGLLQRGWTVLTHSNFLLSENNLVLTAENGDPLITE